jgi:hypothetical protein
MRKLFAILTVGIAAVASSSARVHAGTLDHLICHKMVDPLQISNAVDMITDLQPEFTQHGCKLIKPVEFCVPATKTNVQPPPANAGLGGQSLQNDFVCYRAECPSIIPLPDKNVRDQFGTRIQRKYKPSKICVPAYKEPIPCGGVGRRQCAGACPAGQTCQEPADICECIPSECGGRPDSHGMCGGTCPTAGDVCKIVVAPNSTKKFCGCGPPPPPPCSLNQATGMCGGTCQNPNEKCVLDPTGCVCQPPTPCGPDTSGTSCSGICSNPAEQCVLDATGCHCQQPGCAPNQATGMCSGSCPVPGTCGIVPGTTICGCF